MTGDHLWGLSFGPHLVNGRMELDTSVQFLGLVPRSGPPTT